MSAEWPLSPDELLPSQIAVTLAGVSKPPGFPRPADWQPRTSLRLLAEEQSEQNGLRFRLRLRHREEDAGTAEIRTAILDPADGGAPVSVVLKLQRVEAAHNASSKAVESRLNREQWALKQLSTGAVEDESADGEAINLPRTLQPDGTPRTANEAIRVPRPMVFCMAGAHAIGLNDDYADRENLRNAALRTAVGSDAACVGCRHYNAPVTDSDDNPIPAACRPWMVTHRSAEGLRGLVMSPVRLLILTDMGVSLQKYLDSHLTTRTSGPAEQPRQVVWKLNALHELACTLAAVHRRGWIHLDLNLDNLCISGEGTANHLVPIDFGHAERQDASKETYSDRIPLRRVDFAAAEMHLRSFPLRIRRAGAETWEAWGLIGWPREWWPAEGDLLEVIGVTGTQLLQIVQAEPSERVLRLTVHSMGGSTGIDAPLGQVVDATVHRSPARSSDLCSFGLIALCWLTDLQRPVLYRNELAVFERAVGTAPSGVNDDNWLNVYRGVFGRYSFLLDEVLRGRKKVLEASGIAKEEADLLEYVLVACMRIAIKCVVRHPSWSYCAPDGGGFEAVAADLAEVRDALGRGVAPATIRYPVSFDRFFRWLSREFPMGLSAEERRRNAEYRKSLDVALADVGKAEAELAAVRAIVRKVTAELNGISKQIDQVEAYRTKFLQRRRFDRFIGTRVKALFATLYGDEADDEALLQLSRDVKDLSDRAEEPISEVLRSAADRIGAAARSLPELRFHLKRESHAPAERRRVESIVQEWKEIKDSVDSAVQEANSGKIKVKPIYQERLRVLRDLVGVLLAEFVQKRRELGAHRLQMDRRALDELSVVLEEFRRPAEVILLFARTEYEHQSGIAEACERLSKGLVDRLSACINAAPLSHQGINELHGRVAALKSEMLKLSQRRNWSDRST